MQLRRGLRLRPDRDALRGGDAPHEPARRGLRPARERLHADAYPEGDDALSPIGGKRNPTRGTTSALRGVSVVRASEAPDDAPFPAYRDFGVATALGHFRVDAARADRLLVSALVDLSGQATPPLEELPESSFTCGRATLAKGSEPFVPVRSVALPDSFGRRGRFDILRPSRLCRAADVAWGPIP